MRRNFVLILLIPIVLAGCGLNAKELALQTSVTATRVAQARTDTPTSTSTATSTATPTSIPTEIPTPTPTPFGYYDSDRDGLTDENESIAGTDPVQPDTDGDSLSDYDEVTKYFTNPIAADSDGDGIDDADTEERREYTHTLRALMTIRPPFDVETMTDHYQDVEVIEEGWGLTFQVTFYFDAYQKFEEIPLEQISEWYDGFEAYLTPDPFMNFDEQMSADAWELLSSGASTDLDIVRNMYYSQNEFDVCPCPEGGASSIPEPFLDYYVSSEGQIVSTIGYGYDFRPPDFACSETWIMEHLTLGREMFYNKTHGSCGSMANLHSTVLRSVGIPTRIVQTIPVFNPDDPYQVALLDSLSSQTQGQLQDSMGYNHFLTEAYIGNRWIRVNNWGYEGSPEPMGAFIKIIAFPSWQGVDFANPWGMEGRPYNLQAIEEQVPVHEAERISLR